MRKISLFATLLLITATTVCSAQAPPEKVADVYGQKIHYYEAGQGPAVILLHGLGASAQVWMPVMAPLAAGHHVYDLDQVGFGASDKPLIEYRIATFVDFLHEFMVTQKIAKASLVGNSLGGWISAAFALKYPDMVDRIVLVDAAGVTFPAPPKVDLNPATLADTVELMKALFYNKQMVDENFVRMVFQGHLRNGDGYTIQRLMSGFSNGREFLDDKLPSLKTPTLLLWGRQDELTPLSMGEQMQKLIPGSKLTVLEQCGHVPQIEKPQEFTQAVLGFLGQH